MTLHLWPSLTAEAQGNVGMGRQSGGLQPLTCWQESQDALIRLPLAHAVWVCRDKGKLRAFSQELFCEELTTAEIGVEDVLLSY